MNILFEVKDKRGRTIYLTDERWRHIISEHPGLSKDFENLRDTLIGSQIIIKSRYDEKVCFYYSYIKEKNKYLLVAVKYLNGKGFVITSFYVNKLRK